MIQAMTILNIAAYKFVAICDPDSWRGPLQTRADELELRGTIILASEGINISLAAPRPSIDAFMEYLGCDQLFADKFSDLEIKESISAKQPFRRMVVRIAREIITMHRPLLNLEKSRAAAVDPKTLKTWIDRGHDDNGRPIVLLDTRNDYEIEFGSFENAMHLNTTKFSEFPAAINATISDAANDLRDKTIVSFCTGGIRCEKAALHMQELGVEHVYQLDGGILRYFEEVGGAHWIGECFVFDERISLDPERRETGKTYADRR